jgi:hypothetical protein
MRRRLVLTATIGVLVTACAAGSPPAPAAPPGPPPPLDPTGTYDITVSAQGMEIGGVLIVRGSAEAGYTGSVDTEMGGAALTAIAVEGQTMTFSIPEAGMSAEVTFDGDEFMGWLAGGMGDADIIGVKRSGG